jgi:hypothetical protein
MARPASSATPVSMTDTLIEVLAMEMFLGR